MSVFALRPASSLIGGQGWGFVVPFYSVQDCCLQANHIFTSYLKVLFDYKYFKIVLEIFTLLSVG